MKGMQEVMTADDMLHLLAERGGDSYFGEPVTVLEHSLQAAYFARKANSPDSLIVAALLHDVGHLLHREGEEVAGRGLERRGLDTRHEDLAGRLLSEHLPASVTEPVRLHVAAKRYLCFADPGYLDTLSPASVLSLGLQGGPMSEGEAAAFLALPFAPEAVTLRRWDDEAKIPELIVPALESYREPLNSLWR